MIARLKEPFTLIDGRPFVWRDNDGVLHRGEGADVHRGVRLLWTRCGSADIPAGGAWKSRAGDLVDCPKCRAIESQ